MNQKEKDFLDDYEALFRANRNALPESSSHKNPKMEYHVLADGVFWDDEGLREIEWELSNAFRFVINFRTKLITNSNEPNEFYQQIYKLAQRYFPNWIGFKKERCSHNEELAERIERIRKVSGWKIDKTFKELED